MVARARAAPRSPLLVAVVMAVGFLFSVAGPATGAQRQATIGIFDDDGGLALFPGLTLAPGHQYAQCLLVGAEAATAQDTVLFGVSGVTGDLAQHLRLSVEAGTGGRYGDCTEFTGSSIFFGSLTDLAAAGQGYGVATGWRPAQAASRAFRITVSLEPDLNQQGQQATGSFVWRVLSSAPATPSLPSATPTLTASPSAPTQSPGSLPASGPGRGAGEGPGGEPDEPQRSADASPTPSPTRIVLVEPTPPTGAGPLMPEPDLSIGQGLARLAEILDQARRAAIAVAVEPQYPVTAIMIALFFLLLQDRIDRRDPKLAAVARQRDNEVSFPDRFGVGSVP